MRSFVHDLHDFCERLRGILKKRCVALSFRVWWRILTEGCVGPLYVSVMEASSQMDIQPSLSAGGGGILTDECDGSLYESVANVIKLELKR